MFSVTMRCIQIRNSLKKCNLLQYKLVKLYNSYNDNFYKTIPLI